MTTNFAEGVPTTQLRDGESVLGRAGDEDVLLVRTGGQFFAVGAHCTHYKGALAEGIVVGQTVRCPLHHACFDLRNGDAIRAPALDSIDCWRVEQKGDKIFVREKLSSPQATSPSSTRNTRTPESIVIVGGGAAGLAAADMLRRQSYSGPITMISADDSAPPDRPNLSKDYLSGEAQEDWIPLRPPEYYTEHKIELLLKTHVDAIDVAGHQVVLNNGQRRSFGALLIATGATPVRPPIPGAESSPAHYLRSFSDSRAIIEAASAAKHAVVIGASFIGLEVAASLRTRNLDVDVVAPEHRPLEKILGAELGKVIQQLHETHGVKFHLGETVTRIDDARVTLSGGGVLDADLVVIGVGVRPSIALAEKAGLTMDRGIAVDEHLETSAPGIFAAGDIARWHDRRSGERRRVEHWVVAERQGQVAARNMLGAREPFDAIPFFWSQHYDMTIRYIGYAESWDTVAVDGALEKRDGRVNYMRDGRRLAVATIGRDRENLQAELEMESAHL